MRKLLRAVGATTPVVSLLSVLLVSGCGKKDVPTIPEEIAGHCTYVNKFSNGPECRDYHGDWPAQKILDDCADWGGTADIGTPCNLAETLGACIFEKDGLYIAANVPGNDAGKCGSSLRGCELFGGGAFDPSPICGGVNSENGGGGGGGLPVFQAPIKTCVDPKPGEPPGKSEGGKVCTWNMISGVTEEGRRFIDYASCDMVRTQRPYYFAVPDAYAAKMTDDPRLKDPAYVSELGWVKKQVESAACVCCHSSTAPKGPANWYLEAEGNFINTFHPRGLGQGAGWFDTTALGAYPPEENNGFARATPEDPFHSIFPTTDDARMKRFFEAELAYRGVKKSDFDGVDVGFGPLDSQRAFRPTACMRGEGVRADGVVLWKGGDARYVYVLDAEAGSPTVPPNLDLPKGTKWRLDVPWQGKAIASGTVKYGEVPAGLTQKFPAGNAAPAKLESGKQYYLYVTADVLQPVTRCLFTMP